MAPRAQYGCDVLGADAYGMTTTPPTEGLTKIDDVDFGKSDAQTIHVVKAVLAAKEDYATLSDILATSHTAMDMVLPDLSRRSDLNLTDAEAKAVMNPPPDPARFNNVRRALEVEGAKLIAWHLGGGVGNYPQATQAKKAALTAFIEVQSVAGARDYLGKHAGVWPAIRDTVVEELRAVVEHIAPEGSPFDKILTALKWTAYVAAGGAVLYLGVQGYNFYRAIPRFGPR